MLSYELLQPQDIQQFTEVFNRAFSRVPDMRNMTAVVGKNETGEIKALVGLYSVTVADSMWISPELRHKGIWKKLIEKVVSLPWRSGEGFYLFAANGRENALAKLFNGFLTPFKVWRKKF